MNCIKCCSELPEGATYCPYCGKKQVQERKKLKRANGAGTVYKLSGRRRRPWVAAKNKVVIGYFERKTDALEALERLTGKGVTERYNMTFAEVYQEWSTEHFKTITPGGANSYKIAYKGFSALHDRKFRDLRTKDFQDIIDAKGPKVSITQKYKQLLGQMYRWAMREEIVTQNFGQFVQVQSAPKKEKGIFTDDEIERLVKDDSEAAKIILMLLGTGMRIGELFALKIENCHGNYVVGGSKTEAGRNRVIPIRPEAREYFQYFINQATGDRLLSGYAGCRDADNFRARDYHFILKRLDIPYKSPHSTRHTYTSRAVKEGVPPEILQRILGHTDYAMTANVYTHIDADTLIKAVDVASGLLTNKKEKTP